MDEKKKISPWRAASIRKHEQAAIKFAESGALITDEEISRELGGTQSAATRSFIHCCHHIPWLTIEKMEGGYLFRVDGELKNICEWRQPREELGGISVKTWLAKLRKEIDRRRKENNAERQKRHLILEGTLKIELIKLVDWIENELDKVNPG